MTLRTRSLAATLYREDVAAHFQGMVDYAKPELLGDEWRETTLVPEAVAPLAVDRFGAAGIISYAQNQPTAWSREDESLVRWGHLDSFSPRRTFAFMVSLKQARSFQSRLSAGETVRLQATVKAQRHPGEYEIVTATIPGADPALSQQQIAFTCHLDHPRPGSRRSCVRRRQRRPEQRLRQRG